MPRIQQRTGPHRRHQLGVLATPTYKVHLRFPHAHQARVDASAASRKIVKAGRRGGKTTVAADYAIKRFLKGRRVLYATPTSDQIQKFWTEIKIALREPIQAGYLEVNETMHAVGMPGSVSVAGLESAAPTQRIRAKTAWNADTLRGDYADDLILDEYQLMNEDAWGVVGAPMVIDNAGHAVFIYTPPSLHSRSVSKATDKRHASKLYEAALRNMAYCKQKGLPLEWEAFHWTSMANPHLSRKGLEQVTRDMSALAYRMEILAEETNEAPGALWKRQTIEKTRITYIPEDLIRVVIGVDPPGGSTECGIVVMGLFLCNCRGFEEAHGVVLEDASQPAGTPPKVWAAAIESRYNEWEADWVLGETNFGGDMVESTIGTAETRMRFKAVHASRGKAVRAEPVSVLYEQDKIHHAGNAIKFQNLEDEQCLWVPGHGGPSPNRMDALVWAATDLLVKDDHESLSSGQIVTQPRGSAISQRMTWPTSGF